MDETTKTKNLWGDLEKSIFRGKGIDIGCGPDPVTESVRHFDVEHGDANRITEYVKEDFDFVYASHCLEHMHNPRETLLEWWKLVRVGGHICFIVPDEDLYEQGVFPSRFNADHKATFTLSKQKSWSPVSINVLDLALSLPGGQLIKLVLQDQGYDRTALKHGPDASGCFVKFVRRVYGVIRSWTKMFAPLVKRILGWRSTLDQTLNPDALAQIMCIVKKQS